MLKIKNTVIFHTKIKIEIISNQFYLESYNYIKEHK
jgi:hypothetical protein